MLIATRDDVKRLLVARWNDWAFNDEILSMGLLPVSLITQRVKDNMTRTAVTPASTSDAKAIN